jgi:ribosomal protein L16 Arg81 hydroxylase
MKGKTLSAGNVDFIRMIWPVEPDIFLRDHWEKRRLVLSRNNSSHYNGLFSANEIDSLIHFGQLRFLQSPNTSVLRGLFPEGEALGSTGRLGLTELRKLYGQGKTVLIHSLQLRVAPVATLCRSLEMTLHHPAHVNMYLTPSGAQGFGPHFDDHDVFILQLDGCKHWRLYDSIVQLPSRNFGDPFVSPELLTSPVEEVRLEAGDFLYLPRGFVHEAFTSEQPSLHITVGVEVFRWMDLLISAVACTSRQDVALREAVPVGWLGEQSTSKSMGDQFRKLLRLLADSAELDEALAHLGNKFMGHLPVLPDGRFVEKLEPESINLDTVLQKRSGMICQVVNEGESVYVQFPGNRVRGPRAVSSALRFLAATTGQFTARALPEDLTDDAKLVLLRRLAEEGLLITVVASDHREG